MDINHIFGNDLPPNGLKRAHRTFLRYAKKYQFDPAWEPKLESVPMENGSEIFGIRTLREIGTHGSVPGDGRTEVRAIDPKKSVILGTIRMGFGHYRISLAIASAAHSMGLTPYWLDFLGFPGTTATRTIHRLEDLYNWGSRLSQKFKLFNRLIWEKVTSDMAQKLSYTPRDRELSQLFSPLCGDIPREVPFISTHPWAGLAGVRSGMEQVITVVPDNYPLAFHLVEGSVHAVQTPSSYLGYRSLRNMGESSKHLLNPIPEDEIRYTGHFVDHEIVSNIEADCERRFKRIREKKAKRILLTMGGAGAQVQRFFEIIDFCKDAVRDKQVALFVNMGDHEGRWEELRTSLDARGISYEFHSDWKKTKKLAEDLLDGEASGMHVFLHKDTFAAVYATNLLMRIADLMVTKPSELAFYPVPKLFIQRVGRHEAWGAIRGAEIGDGTMETASIAGVFQTLRIIIQSDDLLKLYCTNIIKNKEIGIYDGAYNVIKLALAGAGKRSTVPFLKSVPGD